MQLNKVVDLNYKPGITSNGTYLMVLSYDLRVFIEINKLINIWKLFENIPCHKKIHACSPYTAVSTIPT